MGDKRKSLFCKDKSSRAESRKKMVKELISEGHTRNIAIKMSKQYVK